MHAIPTTADEASILASFKQGDQQAFRKIHEKCRSAVELFARRLIPRRPDMEDAIQDVFLLLWERRHLSYFESIDKIRNWLIITIRNNYFKNFRIDSIQKREVRNLLQYYAEDERTIDQEAVRAVLLARLDEVLKKLSSQEKKAVELYLKDVSTKEAAPQLGITENSAGNLKRRAFDRLRKELEKFVSLLVCIYYSICALAGTRQIPRGVNRT
jgi:RNA polymerase sigma factor (sigma-70 family)